MKKVHLPLFTFMIEMFVLVLEKVFKTLFIIIRCSRLASSWGMCALL